MSFGLGSVASSSLSTLQQQLDSLFNQASSGKRITSASVDPSGVAIYAALTAQANGYDQAAQNLVDASGALNVASGALSGTSDALSQLANLATQATNDFLTPSQRGDLQVEANQLVQQINTNAQSASYNGTQLLDGPYATPATPATATVTDNAALANGGTLAAGSSAGAASQGGTISLSVVNTGSGAGVNVNFTSSATGQTTYQGVQTPGSTVTVNGTTVSLGNVGLGDVGVTATVQVAPATVGTNGASLQVQTGANEGALTGISTPNGTSAGLSLQNIDLSSRASATNALGQINAAIDALGNAQATLGAQTVAAQYAQDAANNASSALTASASAIGDANTAQLSTQISQNSVQQQLAIKLLANSNAFALAQAASLNLLG